MCVGSHEEVKLRILCQAATGAGAVKDATGAMPPAATGAVPDATDEGSAGAAGSASNEPPAASPTKNSGTPLLQVLTGSTGCAKTAERQPKKSNPKYQISKNNHNEAIAL